MRIERNLTAATVKLVGADLNRPDLLTADLEALVHDEGVRDLTVDLADIEMLASLQIGMLVGIHVFCYENLVKLRFLHIRPKVVKLLKMVGLHILLEAHHRQRLESPEGSKPAIETVQE